jgi:hypothetical protein
MRPLLYLLLYKIKEGRSDIPGTAFYLRWS